MGVSPSSSEHFRVRVQKSFSRRAAAHRLAVPLPCAAPPSDTRPALAADVPTRSSQLAHVRTPWCCTLFLSVLSGARVVEQAAQAVWRAALRCALPRLRRRALVCRVCVRAVEHALGRGRHLAQGTRAAMLIAPGWRRRFFESWQPCCRPRPRAAVAWPAAVCVRQRPPQAKVRAMARTQPLAAHAHVC